MAEFTYPLNGIIDFTEFNHFITTMLILGDPINLNIPLK